MVTKSIHFDEDRAINLMAALMSAEYDMALPEGPAMALAQFMMDLAEITCPEIAKRRA